MSSGKATDLLLSEMAPVVSSVFETMLDMKVNRTETEWSPGPDRVVAGVHLAGHWSGMVHLEYDHRQARRFAARFLRDGEADDSESLSGDVLGELINMIGGNLKCLLASGISLSSPAVVDECAGGGQGSERQRYVAFNCSEGTFWVGLSSQAGPRR